MATLILIVLSELMELTPSASASDKTDDAWLKPSRSSALPAVAKARLRCQPFSNAEMAALKLILSGKP
eukprot:5009742-Karenia_brevis.AAC.1